MLSNQDIETLEDILFAEPWSDHAVDYFGLHGIVCASVVGPAALTTSDLFRLAIGDQATDSDIPPAFSELTGQLAHSLRQSLDMGETIELPEPEDGDPMNALENWCAGFVDTFLEHEESWLEDSEEDVSEALVPILTLSGLFEDEDFQKARDDEQLAQQMADAIPEVLTDLFLIYHAPE